MWSSLGSLTHAVLFAAVRELDCLPPDVDLVTASFPCIDVSRAGCRQVLAPVWQSYPSRRSSPHTSPSHHHPKALNALPCVLQGINGRDTGLVKHVFRLLEGRRVQWVLLENVPGLLVRERAGSALPLVQPA